MNSIQRMQAVLTGAEVDRPPFSFWYNFGLQHMGGEALAQAHIAFAQRFEVDYLRVMNPYPYPLGNMRSFERSSDFLQIPAAVADEGGWGQQLKALELITKALKGKRFILESIDSPWTVLTKLSSPELVLHTAVRFPELLRSVLEIISLAQVTYVQRALSLGISGIFFTLTEAGHDALDPLLHEDLCVAHNQRVLEAAQGAECNILRLESKRPYFDTLIDAYQTPVVSWSHFRAKQSLRSGKEQWKRCVLGGINHETIAHEDPNFLRSYFDKNAEEFFMPGLILGPSGILPNDISLYVLDGVVEAVRSLAYVSPAVRQRAAEQRHKGANLEDNYQNMAPAEELRNYGRRERRPQLQVAYAPEAERDLEEQDFSAPAAVAAPAMEESAPAPEAPPERDTEQVAPRYGAGNGSPSALPSSLEEQKLERAPRWAASRFQRRDYQREDRDNTREGRGSFERRFDMAYRQDEERGERRGRLLRERGDSLKERSPRHGDKRRSERSGERGSWRSDRPYSGRSSRYGKEGAAGGRHGRGGSQERYKAREAKRQRDNWGARPASSKPSKAGGEGVKRLRIPRNR